MDRSEFLILSYLQSVQLTNNQLTKSRRIKFLDKYILQLACVSVLFLLCKIGAEAFATRLH